MAFILLLVMLTACAATPEDLRGQMLVFPEETATAHVKLTTSEETFSALTVCLRSITDLRREHTLFSMSTASSDNAFLIFKTAESNVVNLNIWNKFVPFGEQDYKLNAWQSICSTWDSKTGLVQLWLNGRPSIMKYIGGSNIVNPITILGQEQDSYGGGFNKDQSFVGMMADVQVWNYVRSPCQIERYMGDLNYSPGNLINWRLLEYQITGRVLIQDKQATCPRRNAYGTPHYN